MQVEIVYTQPVVVPPPVPAVQYYMQQEDRIVFGSIRECAPCPAVFVLKDDPHAKLSQQWQYYLRAINYAMPLEDVFLIVDAALAFANRTGFRQGNIKADYFHNLDLAAPLPSFDKVRTCSRSVVTGTEQYSVMEAIRSSLQLIKDMRAGLHSFRFAARSFRQAVTSQNVLNVWTFDSMQLPPLKPGKTYPRDISQVNADDYLYMPERDREKFLVATIVNARGEVVQFPRGGLYSWTHDNTPYTFVPHISNHTYGAVLYPMRFLQKIPLGSAAPNVYRRI